MAARCGANALRSVTWIWHPPHVSFACLWNVGSKKDRPEHDARQPTLIHLVGESIAVNPGAPTSSNGLVVPRPSESMRALEEHRARIDDRGIERRNVGGRQDPWQPGLVEEHRARPTLHRDDVNRGRDPEMVVEEPRQLADRHAVAHRDRELTDERRPCRVERGSLDRVPPIGFGRSHTTTRMPCRRAARRQFAIV